MLCDESFGMRIAHGGALFGKISLREVLNDDTEAGQLILSSCSSVLLTLTAHADGIETPRVYEVEILPGFKGKDVLYVSLNETCVGELRFSNGMTSDVEIQFRLNRSNFEQMHGALGAVRTSNSIPLLFPDGPASGQPGGKPVRYGLFVFLLLFWLVLL